MPGRLRHGGRVRHRRRPRTPRAARDAGARALLVGTSIMRDPELLDELVRAVTTSREDLRPDPAPRTWTPRSRRAPTWSAFILVRWSPRAVDAGGRRAAARARCRPASRRSACSSTRTPTAWPSCRRALGLDRVQLHGSEPPRGRRALRRARHQGVPAAARRQSSPASTVLLDRGVRRRADARPSSPSTGRPRAARASAGACCWPAR